MKRCIWYLQGSDGCFRAVPSHLLKQNKSNTAIHKWEMREFLIIVLSMPLSVCQFSPGQWSCWFCSYQESRKMNLRLEGRKDNQVNSGLQCICTYICAGLRVAALLPALQIEALGRNRPLKAHFFEIIAGQLFSSTIIPEHLPRWQKPEAYKPILGNSKDMGSVAVGTPWPWGVRCCSSDTSSVRYLGSKQSLFCTVFPFLFLMWQICVNVYSCTIEVVTGKWEVLAAE